MDGHGFEPLKMEGTQPFQKMLKGEPTEYELSTIFTDTMATGSLSIKQESYSATMKYEPDSPLNIKEEHFEITVMVPEEPTGLEMKQSASSKSCGEGSKLAETSPSSPIQSDYESELDDGRDPSWAPYTQKARTSKPKVHCTPSITQDSPKIRVRKMRLPAEKPAIQQPFQNQKKWPNSDEKSKQLDRLITEMIITDSQPFTMVSDAGFKRLLAVAEPRYTLKNEKFYRTEMLEQIHRQVVAKIKTLIQAENAGQCLAFTTDCWSSTTESLMSLTCHFIDNSWKRNQVVLNTKAMHGSHTDQYIREIFLGMLDDWGIGQNRVMLVLRDNGANMVKGMKLVDLPDLSCTAHLLQLVVNDGLMSQRAVIDITAMLKKCATHFHHSVLAKERLGAIQNELGLPKHSLIQAVPTRWNSTLHMLQRMLEQRCALNAYAGKYGGYECPNADQWDIVSNLVETLLLVEEVTLDVSQNTSSLSCIIPCLTVLKMLLQDDEGPSTRGIGTLKQVMRESLSKRFPKLEETKCVVLACFLDPRYKHHAFSCEQTAQKAKEWLCEDIAQQGQIEESNASIEAKRKRIESIASHGRIDEMFNHLLGPHTSKAVHHTTIEDEVDLYIKEPLIDRRNGDPLLWWSENEGRFQLLAAQARRYLCPPPCSLPSERVFSEISLVHDKNRSRLTGENAERLCFLHHNLVLLDWKY
ncbi:zinc finger BED domain-containing protein 4-like [Chanos chanos]|uniref:Zinc finger BED domain-containing protein 4-like n=1 Tax=Chanos chanos TaxID=29144 RepID=A0A6J2WBU7_CHACN|nr:zinc finger BED domain-containing protein 4-like [Chanos chanos]